MNENSNEKDIWCFGCPFTCKGAETCEPRLLLDKIKNYLPSVIDYYDKSTLIKPSVSLQVELNGRTYYINK